MSRFVQSVAHKLNANKFIAAFVIVASVVAIGTTSVASAAPDYFDVDKPGDPAICQGGEWKTVHRWRHWRRHQVWVPNWEKLGFESKRQCIRFVSTEKPTSKKECKEDWRKLGFDSRSDCKRYLRLFPGGGYGGENQNNEHNNED